MCFITLIDCPDFVETAIGPSHPVHPVSVSGLRIKDLYISDSQKVTNLVGLKSSPPSICKSIAAKKATIFFMQKPRVVMYEPIVVKRNIPRICCSRIGILLIENVHIGSRPGAVIGQCWRAFLVPASRQ